MFRWHLANMTSADLKAILEIEQISFRWPWGRISFESELQRQNAFNYIVKSNNDASLEQVIAYVILRLIVDELHILKIAVKPAWRGQGIATWLLEQCFKLGGERGAESIRLEVRTSNIPAVGLYQKLGFKVIANRPRYYTDTKEDALIMMKNLKEDI